MITLVLTIEQRNKVLEALAKATFDAGALKTFMESPAAKQACDEQKALLDEMLKLLMSWPGLDLRELVLDYQSMCERLNHELYQNAGDSEEIDTDLYELKKRAGTLLPDEPSLQIEEEETD